jgi:hypothetical protein
MSGECSLAMMASLMAAMQQKLEHHGWARSSLDPTHCRKATRRGVAPSEGRARWPPVGPEALRRRSSSMFVITLLYRPWPNSLRGAGSKLRNPVATMTALAAMLTVSGTCS